MNSKKHLEKYVNFNQWANSIITEWIFNNDLNCMNVEVKSSFSTIDKTLAHIWVAEYIWLKRIIGEAYENPLQVFENKSTHFIVEKLMNSSHDLVSFINDLPDERLQDIINYRLLSGDEGAASIADILQHVVNHSTYHRGQLVTMGRGLEFSQPPKTDYMEYVRIIAQHK